MMQELIVIGGGPAGLTAGIYAARAGLKPWIAAGPLPGGLLMQTGSVENYPGFPEGIKGYDLMERFRDQAVRFGAEIADVTMTSAQLDPEKGHLFAFSDGTEQTARSSVIAVGSTPKWLGLVSEQRLRGHGVSACATCDGAFFRNVTVVVAGGGDSAMEEALFLTRFASIVHIIHRRSVFRASKIMADRVRNHPKIRIHWDTEVIDILGNDHVEGVTVRHKLTGRMSSIECRGFFAALGYKPNTQELQGQLAMDAAGYISLIHPTSQTSMISVFAAGDCADPDYRQAITAAGSGCRAAMDAIRYLEEK